LRFVNNVVVNECCGVDNLNHRPELDRAATFVVEQLRRKQQECWANSLSATAAKVFADLSDRRNVRDSVASELALNRSKIVAKKIENLSSVGGGYRAHLFFTTETRRHRENQAERNLFCTSAW